MITNKRDLVFYLMADRIMNGCPAKTSLKDKVLTFLNMGVISV